MALRQFYLRKGTTCPQRGCKKTLFVYGTADTDIPNLRMGAWCRSHGQQRLLTDEEIDFIVDKVAEDHKVEGEEDARRWASSSKPGL